MFKIRKIYIAAFFLSLLFLWTRFYNIETSFNFINDMGRDFLVLWQWKESGKPPLLGPQTSALPFNQSAIYFYFLYPFYLLSGQSYYASLIAYSVFYLASFGLGLYLLRFYPRLEKSLLLVFLLITVHPQYISQGRFIWNPSFVTPCILAAFYSLVVYLQQKKPQKLLLIFSAFSISLATAFSYSALPALIAFLSLVLYFQHKKALSYFFYVALSLFLVNLPTIAFELRHGFLLSKMMLFGDKLPQSNNSFLTRLFNLSDFSFVASWPWALFYIILLIIFIYLNNLKEKNNFLRNSIFLFIITLCITLFSPISIHAHYIFGVLPLFFLVISFLRPKYIFLSAIFFYIVYMQAALKFNYFAPARNNLKTLTTCAENFCQNHQEAIFVSNQSKHHPYHNAMEWNYLMAKAGCQVKDINLENGLASEMVVVLDDSSYLHGETAFYELTLFGQSKEIERSKCSETIEMVLLKK